MWIVEGSRPTTSWDGRAHTLRQLFLRPDLLKDLQVIVGSKTVHDFFAAERATMENHPSFFGVMIHARGLHQSFACGKAVSRSLGIHMLAPKALGAMIAVSAAAQRFHVHGAVPADERFLTRDKGHVQIRSDALRVFSIAP